MGRMRRSNSVVSLSRDFALTIRRGPLDRVLYRIDGRDRRHVVVLVADDLTAAQEARAERAIEADLDALARRFRRRDLEPVAELEGDEPADLVEGLDDVVLEVVR